MSSTPTAPGPGDQASEDPSAAASGASGTGTTTTAPPEAPEAPTPPPPGGTGFFDWLRGLDLPRRPGWIGGVSAGVAARLGIDPVIVRGILVVLSLFGAPAFLAYGVAWLLLPDERGRIHLEQTIRGVYDNALVGIGIFLVIGLFAPAVGLPWWFDGWPWGWEVGGPFDAFRVLWSIIIVGGIAAGVVWLVSWLTHRDAAATAASAGTDASTSAGDAETAWAASGDAATPAMPAAPAAPRRAPNEPMPPGAAGSTEDYDAWKAQHAAWRIEYDAWKRSQAEAGRAARAQSHAEHRARAAEYAAAAEAARAERRRLRPRTSFAYVVATFGASMLAGATASFLALSSATQADWAVPIGLAAAALVTALAMVLAGILRRRSGFLAFATVLLLIGAVGTATGPRAELAWASSTGSVRSATLMQPVGDVSLTLDDDVAGRPGTPQMTVLQGAGSVRVEVRDGTRLSLDVECGSCYVELARGFDDGDLAYTDGIQLTAGRDSVSSWQREIGEGTEPGVADANLTVRAGASRITVVQIDDRTDSEER